MPRIQCVDDCRIQNIQASCLLTTCMYVYSKFFCDLQKGRVLEYKVTDKNYILQEEVRKHGLYLFFYFTKIFTLYIFIYCIIFHSSNSIPNQSMHYINIL